MPDRLILVRHGPAATRDPRKWPEDGDRPLRPAGRKELKEASKGLALLLDQKGMLGSSPYARAWETAAILNSEWKVPKEIVPWTELLPEGHAEEIFERMDDGPLHGDLVLVGHEPLLSQFVGYCVFGERFSAVRFSKGGAVALEFPKGLRPGAGRMLWYLTRRQLMRLGRAGKRGIEEDE
jgi:phosphohistidine phosphatase